MRARDGGLVPTDREPGATAQFAADQLLLKKMNDGVLTKQYYSRAHMCTALLVELAAALLCDALVYLTRAPCMCRVHGGYTAPVVLIV